MKHMCKKIYSCNSQWIFIKRRNSARGVWCKRTSMSMTTVTSMTMNDDDPWAMMTTIHNDPSDVVFLRLGRREFRPVILDWLSDLLCCLGSLDILRGRIGWMASAGSVSCWARLRGRWAARTTAPLREPPRQRGTHDEPACGLWWRASCVPHMASEERSSTGGTNVSSLLIALAQQRRELREANSSEHSKPKCGGQFFRWQLRCSCVCM